MTRKQFNFLSHRARPFEEYGRIMAFAGDTVHQDLNGMPEEPVKTLPYEDIRQVIDGVVQAETYRHSWIVLGNPLAEAEEKKEMEKVLAILTKHNY